MTTPIIAGPNATPECGVSRTRVAFRNPARYYVRHPGDAWRELRWCWQRALYGYADVDVWSLCDYLQGWLPAAIRDLADDVHGTPMDFYQRPDGTEVKDGLAKWQATLRAIADDLDAGARYADISACPYPPRDRQRYTLWHRKQLRQWRRGWREAGRWMWDMWD